MSKKILPLLTTRAFTLVEILIVIAIIAILGAVVFTALDPLTRFRDARDATRATDVESTINAINIDLVDNGGTYLSAISNMTSSEVYMVVNGTAMTAGCDDNNAYCDTDVTGDTHCVDLSGLVTEGYLGVLPTSPVGAVSWDDGSSVGNEGAGYTLQYASSTGILTVRACESENRSEIFSVR